MTDAVTRAFAILGVTHANSVNPAKTPAAIAPVLVANAREPLRIVTSEPNPVPQFADIRSSSQRQQTASVQDSSLDSQHSQRVPTQTQKPLGLLEVIKRMAVFYEYTEKDLSYAMAEARKHPDNWRWLIRNDRNAALFIDPLAPHQVEAVGRLRADSALRSAFTVRVEDNDVIVTLAVRDMAVCDLIMPASAYDPLMFWETIQEVSQGLSKSLMHY